MSGQFSPNALLPSNSEDERLTPSPHTTPHRRVPPAGQDPNPRWNQINNLFRRQGPVPATPIRRTSVFARDALQSGSQGSQDLGSCLQQLSLGDTPASQQSTSSRAGIGRLPSSNLETGFNQGAFSASVPKQQTPTPTQPAGGRGRGRFTPMVTVTHPRMTGRDFGPEPVEGHNFSPRYHGMHSEANASADHLPSSENCALWLTNLPHDVTVRELLASVRNIGRIYATYINEPDFANHSTAAAKLVFFKPEPAQTLLARTAVEPILVRGHRVKMALNRIKTASNSTENGESRVLIVTGDEVLVNVDALTRYFQARFTFQLDEARTLLHAFGRAVVEYRFGSYRCQAQMGYKALSIDRPDGLEHVEFGKDPCEVGSELTSFTVAAQRIQGEGIPNQ